MHETATCVASLADLVTQADNQDACLVTIYPASFGNGVINLARSTTLIGRDMQCDIELDDPAASRLHASVSYSPEGYQISDLDSFNATYVNDIKVTKRALKSGDIIRIGHTMLKFLTSDHVEKQYHEELYSLITTDGLTEIANKRFYVAMLEREFNRAWRHQRPLSLIMFDIDHFKKINDSYGHLAGDFILRELCRRLTPFIRHDELFARYGGEEFSVIVPEGSVEQARVLSEKMLTAINSAVFSCEGVDVTVSISIGIAELDSSRHHHYNDLIASADKKLYAAKNNGRNCIQY